MVGQSTQCLIDTITGIIAVQFYGFWERGGKFLTSLRGFADIYVSKERWIFK